ncbi:hypothetical protein FRC08_010137 [Ceratobasidium sp. 394]|nr:hypothetical protein FRC08_010137 [Ceratobasidium sp. 394]KAG9101469.1 hypothetical protein FS749_006688 [Ceratobasidium sp. UAMH 11750]
MSLAIAEYLVTKGCLVDVLDRVFDNPPHVPCYEVGGCQNCVRQRQLDEAEDRLAQERLAKREEIELDIKMYEPNEEKRKHKERSKRKEHERSPKETKVFKEKLVEWREHKYQQLLEELDIPLDAFMSDKELQKIAKFKVTGLDSFAHPEVEWFAPAEWKTEALQAIQDAEQAEASRIAQEEAKKRGLEEERKQAQDEKRRKKELERQEKQREKQLKAQATQSKKTQSSAPIPVASTSSATLHHPPTSQDTTHTDRLGQGRPVSRMQIYLSK